MGKQYSHLDLLTRNRIQALRDDGYGVRKIGRTLSVPYGTVSREFKRNSHEPDGRTDRGKRGAYRGATAHHKACARRKDPHKDQGEQDPSELCHCQADGSLEPG